jgi:plastocyanin
MTRPHHRSLTTLAAAAAAAVLLVSGCSGSSPAPQGSPSITFGPDVSTTPGMAGHGMTGAPAAPQGANAVGITNFAFVPATLTVPVGATVTWTNHDGDPHTIAAGDGSFHSPGMDTNATYSSTFPTAGTFDYNCWIHPFMHGTVVVTK